MGAGVGRVLSRVALHRKKNIGSGFEDVFVCLEKPERSRFLDQMISENISVNICPDVQQTKALLNSADIVQIEWWQHPVMAKWLYENEFTARLVVWSHISGLYYPEIPLKWIATPDAFLFSSRTSIDAMAHQPDNCFVVSSSGGFEDVPDGEQKRTNDRLNYGYLGSLNYAKLHPDFLRLISDIQVDLFELNVWGDISVNRRLQGSVQTNDALSRRIKFHGYTDEPAKVLKELDVFVYLLNPNHYGTTENALLEAMAAGVVPIVFNNIVEASIVTHKKTGMIVETPQELSEAVSFLENNPSVRLKMAENACREIRKKYSIGATVNNLQQVYMKVLLNDKKEYCFKGVFGDSPAEWFFSCATKYLNLLSDSSLRVQRTGFPMLYDSRKSSPIHFSKVFPEDERLQGISKLLKEDMNDASS